MYYNYIHVQILVYMYLIYSETTFCCQSLHCKSVLVYECMDCLVFLMDKRDVCGDEIMFCLICSK